jgi:two-component system LytT family response regulator
VTHELSQLGGARDATGGGADGASSGAAAGAFRERFLVSVGNRDTVVPADEIAWIQANGYYASLVGRDRKEYLVRLPLEQLERELDPTKFLRIHRSAIVRIADVRGLDRTARRGAAVLMRDGTRIPISRSRREAVALALGATNS